MGNKDLLLSFVKAETEEEVKHIIDEHPILSQAKNWKPYGGFRGNFSQIHNQQGNAIPALVEKPINSIDALLIKECRLDETGMKIDRVNVKLQQTPILRKEV